MEQEANRETVPAENKHLRERAAMSQGRRYLLAAAICAFLAAPAFYLAWHLFSGKPSSAATEPMSAEDSIRQMEAVVQSQPTEDNQLNLSLAYLNANRLSNAMPLLQRLVSQYPANAKAWNNLCVAHNLKSEFNDAIDACHHAISLDPGFQLAQNNLHWAEAQKQKALDAMAAVEALPPGARTSASYLNEGLDALHAGEYDRALAIWLPLASREPKNAPAANNIGVAYMMKHDPAQAIPWFEKAMQLDPGAEMTRNNLAWAQSEQAGSAGK